MCRRFPVVHVVNPGEPMRATYFHNPATGRLDIDVEDWGESYCTSCPFCADSRDRMSVSHRWGVHDRVTDSKGYGLWRCYNEDCQRVTTQLSNGDTVHPHRQALRRMLETHLGGDVTFRVPPPVVPSQVSAKAFNGRFVPLVECDPAAPAVTYLRDTRRFDVEELWNAWGVGVAADFPAGQAWLNGDIVIPVFEDRQPVGWQSRLTYDPVKGVRGVPKYLSHFPKSKHLYGGDQAATEPYLAAFEGVTDVWRYGPGGVCWFGHRPSRVQVGKMVTLLAGRPLILVPDADDPDSPGMFGWAASHIRAAGHRGHIGVVGLPPGTDAAKFDRGVLRAAVAYGLTQRSL